MSDETQAFNLSELPRFKGVRVERTGNHVVFHLPNGRTAGLGLPPRTYESERIHPSTLNLSATERFFFTSDPSSLVGAKALMVLDQWGGAVRAALANDKLSPAGRHELIVDATMKALRALGGHFVELQAIGSKLEEQHRKLYAPPAADVAATILDVEVRSLYRGMALAEQLRALTDLAQERLLLAVLRAPSPLSERDSKIADEAWARKVMREKPEEAATLQIAEALHGWALGLVRFIVDLFANPSTSGTTGAIDRFAIYRELRAIGAVELLDFTAAELATFEHKLARSAAAA